MAESEFHEDRLLRSALGPSADCLPVETLAAVAEARLDDSAMAKAGRHLQICAHCRNEFDMLTEFQTAVPRPDEMESVAWIESRLRSGVRRSAPAPLRPRWSMAAWLAEAFAGRRWQTMSLAAACLLFVVAGGVYLRQGRETLSPAGIGEPVWRSLQFAAVSPAGDVSGAPSELTWEAVPGAARYEARVLEVDRTQIWKSESTATTLELPAAVRRQMVAGRTFLWSVVARDAAGRTLAESGVQTFHISLAPR